MGRARSELHGAMIAVAPAGAVDCLGLSDGTGMPLVPSTALGGVLSCRIG